MKLISINIELNKHYTTVFDFIKKENPDVICLQEVLEEDFDRFKTDLSMQGIFKARRYFAGNPHYEGVAGKREGVAIFSKNIINSGAIFYEGSEENVAKSFDEYMSDEKNKKNSVLVWTEIKDSDGKIYKYITTHLPVTKDGESTPYQLEVVDILLNTLSNLGEFVICGDMNAPRGNETFTRLAKKYKDNIPEKYKNSIDQNLHRVKNLQHMVDGLFTTPTYMASEVKLVDGVSDHMAIIAEIEKN